MKHIETGTHVSHYRIERRIGSGGMGAVFLARDLTLDRLVAIKFLTAQDDERSRKRLLREAQAVAALDHEGIAHVYEVGTDPIGGDFIVMQYVEGETLAARLRRGRLEPAEALAIAGRVAEALVTAHSRGIIHRDLKPQNIIITPGGMPKLLDFGLATRTASTSADAEAQTVTASVTTHAVYGTPSYMSPEQVRNKVADARSDVFALGCVLHECLTGRRAFTGDSSAEIFGAVLHVEPPSVSSIVLELDPSYDALCARMLKKKSIERFQSASEALGAIHALMDTSRLAPGQTDADSRQKTARMRIEISPRVKWAILAAAVLVTAVGVSGWKWYRGDALPTPPPDAARYYAMGVEALREGTYARARDSFNAALALFDTYVQAYSGLAQAQIELDDERAATSALLRVNELVPDRTRLATDDRLRLEAVLASVQRTHSVAIDACRRLAERHPDDSGAWLELGRANEAAEFRKEARVAYEKALALDAQSPAAHVRLGAMLVQLGEKDRAFGHFDEARRLYRLASNFEGEAEAVLRKGTLLTDISDLTPATEALLETIRLASDRYPIQRIRAKFQLARVASLRGNPEELVAPTEAVLREAKDAGLNTVAANGLVDFAGLFVRSNPARADAELARAVQSASDLGAKRTQMRAQLQRAFLRVETKPDEAVAMADAPLKFYSGGKYPMLEATAKSIVSRAKEALGELADAIRLSTDVLKIADAHDDEALATDALVSLGPQLETLGRLPEALQTYERMAVNYRRSQATPNLAYALLRKAELLIVLGRGSEADAPIAEVELGIATKADTNLARPRRVARLRALLAATEGRFGEIEKFAALARVEKGKDPDATDISARVLAEYAAAHRGQTRTPVATLALLPQEESSIETRRDLSYWVAQALRVRGENARAHKLAQAALGEALSDPNPEIRWRLATVANLTAPTQIGATMPPRAAGADFQKLKALWGAYDSIRYFNRADLKPLLK